MAGLRGDLARTTEHGALSIVAAISSLYPITPITLGLLLYAPDPRAFNSPESRSLS